MSTPSRHGGQPGRSTTPGRTGKTGKTGQGGKSGRPGKPYRRPRKDPVRILAFEALRAVDERDAYANLVLPPLLRKAREKDPDEGGLDARDAALATELVYGTLRWQGTYDAIIAECVDRPLRQVDPPVLDVLSLGAHQLLGTRIPQHAAVSATVELARVVLGDGRAKFVNAVLRRITADDLEGWLERVAPPYDEDPEEHLALRHAHPRWVVSALWDALPARARQGGGRADITALLEADNERPEVTLVARPGRASVEELSTGETAPGRWSPYAVRMAEGGEPGALDAVREGRAGVQDEGSQLVALALADAPVEGGSDRHWLDVCAGPGGKAALLGALAAGRGATLLAAEKQPHRARLVARALQGNPGPWAAVSADGTRPAWRPGSFDRVLVDVPCTGLGALRRRPEARWRRTPEDLAGFAPLQRGLLRQAVAAARVGGVVAYATCSPHLAETRAVVDDVLRGMEKDPRGPAAELLDARPLLPGVPELGEGPDVQLWPHLHGTDAMYLALLRRTA
ncbi:rRNA cytosine-C5-methyltransferase [Streptomyces diacarni]|uniref:rRNA cytosine-C5-methyltransferase n=1 Tax=Streptomyces diacarni TaxID=2800381 RepID=A0A367EGT7_9ACTN|nr:transcription antitermination factor NusB [Streptomyces diacarni]RCG17284.1 rRNA cytosine-C5-methyltransferase [Streptomyces diacarni]